MLIVSIPIADISHMFVGASGLFDQWKQGFSEYYIISDCSSCFNEMAFFNAGTRKAL